MVTLDNRSRKVPVKILLNRMRGGLSFSIQIFMFLYDPTRKCKEKYLNFDDLLLRVSSRTDFANMHLRHLMLVNRSKLLVVSTRYVIRKVIVFELDLNTYIVTWLGIEQIDEE